MTPCIIGTGYPQRGGHLRIWRGGRLVQEHRAAWEEINGPIPVGMKVLHTCDNPPCRNIEHLFLGTTGDNSRDCVTKGRSPVGEKNGRAKLTAPSVTEIKRRLHAGESMSAIARDFDVCYSTIRPIRDGKTWTHITGGRIGGPSHSRPNSKS